MKKNLLPFIFMTARTIFFFVFFALHINGRHILKCLLIAFLCVGFHFSLISQNLQWAKAMGDTLSDMGKSLVLDTYGNIYTTGSFRGTVDFDPGAGSFNLTSTGTGGNVFISKLDASGNFVWAKAMNGSASSIVLDASGNIYTMGSFTGTVDFDPGVGSFNLTSAWGFDIFVSKLDASGNFVWAKAMGGTGNDVGYSIALDTFGNIYTTGSFKGTADFDPGAGSFDLTSASFESDIFISKLDVSGNFVWAKAMGGTLADVGNSLVLDAFGNVYTTGSFYGTVDFDPGSGSFDLTSKGGSDIFISKLGASGNFVWAKSMGGAGEDLVNSLVLDAYGNIYTTGSFRATADFDPGAGSFDLTSVGFGADIFISKLDVSGNFVWAKAMGGTSTDVGNSVVLDAFGNVYTTGSFYGTADFDPGVGTFNLTSAGFADIFIAKLDASGNFVWAKSMGGTGTGNDVGTSIALDASDAIYITGYFIGTVDFDPEAGVVNLISAGSNDIFIVKLNSVTGVNEWNNEDSFFIYPNPSTGKFEIKSEKTKMEAIEVYNVIGEKVYSEKISNPNSLILTLDVPNGIYFVHLKTEKGTETNKLVLQK